MSPLIHMQRILHFHLLQVIGNSQGMSRKGLVLNELFFGCSFNSNPFLPEPVLIHARNTATLILAVFFSESHS